MVLQDPDMCCTYIYRRAESDIRSYYPCDGINIVKGVMSVILHQTAIKKIGNSLQFLGGSSITTASQSTKANLLKPSTNIFPVLCSVCVFIYSEYGSDAYSELVLPVWLSISKPSRKQIRHILLLCTNKP